MSEGHPPIPFLSFGGKKKKTLCVCPSPTALLNYLECPPDYNKRKVMTGNGDNEKPCIKQNALILGDGSNE